MWKRLIWAENCSFNWSVCWSFVVKSSHQIQDKLQRGRGVFLLIISWTSDNISKSLHSWSCGLIWGLFHFLSLFLSLSVSYTHKNAQTTFFLSQLKCWSVALIIKTNAVHVVFLSNHSLGIGEWGRCQLVEWLTELTLLKKLKRSFTNKNLHPQ